MPLKHTKRVITHPSWPQFDAHTCDPVVSTQLRLNPAPALTLYNNLSLKTFSSLYTGSFSKLTHVLVLGRRVWSVPLSRILNLGVRLPNPSNGARGVLVTNLSTFFLSLSSRFCKTFQNICTQGCSAPSSPMA